METNKIMYSARIQKAINLAIKTHELDDKQRRKGKDIPYVTHPLTVGLILSRAGASEDVVIAGILHDTIEDSSEENKVSYELIQEMFGTEAADLVLSVTETGKGLSWDERKAAALEHIAHFSEGSVLVKSADILSNCTEILADYEVSGDDMFARFNNGKESVLANYARVIDALINQWPESPLALDLKGVRAPLAQIGGKLVQMSAYPSQIIAHADYSKDTPLTCPVCGWEGSDGVIEYFNTLHDVSCPKCGHMLAVVQYPVIPRE